jgi:hypothetical protein
MISWADYVYGMCAGVFLTGFARALLSWRILRSWSSDQRKPR